MAASDLTAARLRELLSYEPTTGMFFRLSDPRPTPRPAGTLRTSGYIAIGIDRRVYLAHRLAWLYMTGSWPTIIDHLDGVRANNAFANLRDATQALNMQNQRRPKVSNALGFLGVTKNGPNFKASIWVDRRQVNVGTFKTPEDAHEAYLVAKRQLHSGCTI